MGCVPHTYSRHYNRLLYPSRLIKIIILSYRVYTGRKRILMKNITRTIKTTVYAIATLDGKTVGRVQLEGTTDAAFIKKLNNEFGEHRYMITGKETFEKLYTMPIEAFYSNATVVEG